MSKDDIQGVEQAEPLPMGNGSFKHVIEVHHNYTKTTQNNLLVRFLDNQSNKTDIDSSIRKPVIFGGDYVDLMRTTHCGKEALVSLKTHIKNVLNAHDHVYVLHTNELLCLENNPDCINQLLNEYPKPKRVSLFFIGSPSKRILDYLKSRNEDFSLKQFSGKRVVDSSKTVDFKGDFHKELNINSDDLQYPIRMCVDYVYDSATTTLDSYFDKNQREQAFSFRLLEEEKFKEFLVNGMMTQNKSVKWVFENSRRKILHYVFKHTLKQYRSGMGSITDFYNTHYKDILEEFGINPGQMSHFSPNLHKLLADKKLLSQL